MNRHRGRAAIYCRVSTERQVQRDLSIPAQLDAIQNYCRDRSYDVVAEYIDRGISGTTTRRPEFQKLLTACADEPRPFDVIVVYSIDRFGRAVSDAVTKSKIRAKGIAVEYVHGPSVQDGRGQFEERIFEAVAQEYSEQLRRLVPRGQRQAVRNGRHGTGIAIAPFGYQIATKMDGKRARTNLEPDSTTAAILKQIFERYDNGQSIRSLARWLDETTPTQAVLNNRPPRGKTHGRWLGGTVLRILRNPVYRGIIVYGRRNVRKIDGKVIETRRGPDSWTTYENGHEALITMELFERVQARLRQQVKCRPRPDRPQNILATVGTCAACGGSVTMEHNGLKGRSYYYCRSYRRHKIGENRCKRALRRETIERAVCIMLSSILRPDRAPIRMYYYSAGQEGADLSTLDRPDPASLEKAVAAYNTGAAKGPDPEELTVSREIYRLEHQASAVVNAIQNGKPLRSLIDRLSELEDKLSAKRAYKAALVARVSQRFVKLDPAKIAKDAKALVKALEDQDMARLRNIIPFLVSQVRINFGYEERRLRKEARDKGLVFDGSGSVVVRMIYDLTNLETAGDDAVRELALLAAV